jgi:hypothetical protein
VQADVDVDVAARQPGGGSAVVVAAGPQQLDGRSAVAYATYSAGAQEPEEVRLARFNDVLEPVLRALPGNSDQVAATLAALGKSARSNVPKPRLAALLAAVQHDIATDQFTTSSLPVRTIDTGGDDQRYGLDEDAVPALLRQAFGDAALPSGEQLRVLVENGRGTPGLVQAARAKLVARGLRFVDGGNARQFGAAPTVVLIQEATSQARQRGERVAAALGVSTDAVQVTERGQNVADVVVVLGRDFKP